MKGIGEKQVDVNFYVMNIAAAALDKVLGKFLKMFPSKMAASTNQTALGVEPTKWVDLYYALRVLMSMEPQTKKIKIRVN